MRHLGFGLDVSKVVESVLDADATRWGGGEQDEGWDMVEEREGDPSKGVHNGV